MSIGQNMAILPINKECVMEGYNKTIIIGRLKNEPKQRVVDGKLFCQFTIASTIIDSDKKECVVKHEIVCANKQAELCAKHITKGMLVCVEGVMSDKGNVVCQNLVFLSPAQKKETCNEAVG
jgi:hypothetical protein